MNGKRGFFDRFRRNKYFGMYRGTVVHNDDPKNICRLRANVPEIFHGAITDWALPCMPYGGLPKQGMFMVPDVGAKVWIEFEAGDISRPIWVGTFWIKSWVPELTTRLIQTQSGHILQFDDEEGKETIRLKHASGAGLWIDSNGSVSLEDDSGGKIKLNAQKEMITLEDANENNIKLSDSGILVESKDGNVIEMSAGKNTLKDANGNKIELSDSGILVESKYGDVIEMADGKITLDAPTIVLKGGQVHLGDEGGEAIIKGQSFLQLFATHVHTVAPVVGGPSSPPIPQGEISSLSTTVKSK